MAFNIARLAQIGSSLTNNDIQTFWSYNGTTDTMTAMKTSGYFNAATKLFTQRDIILLTTFDTPNFDQDLLAITSTTAGIPVEVGPFISAGDLADDTILTTHIVDGSITAPKIDNNAVITAKILDANVTTAKILDANITTAKILDANVTAAKLGPDSVTTVKILDANVTGAKLAPNAVTTIAILDANVTAPKMATNSIITTSILDANVTLAKLAAGITPSHVVKFGVDAFTTLGGAAAEAITVAGVLATDIVHVTLRAVGSTPRTIVTAIPSTDTITVTFSGDPSTDHIVTYTVLRAAA